jgi:hypothetical protein
MSSTNRGRARNTLDQYETPWSAVELVIPYLPRTRVLLDPCCGTGAMIQRAGVELHAEHVHGIEVDDTRPFVHFNPRRLTNADALTVPWPECDLILTNPPFNLAMDFVFRALQEVTARGTTVAMLLRLAFLASATRAPFHIANPSDVFVLAKRPSFTEDGKSDSADYAWFIWGVGRGGRWKVLA